MLGRGFPVAIVALLLAAGCGGDGRSSPPATDSTAPASSSTTTEPATPGTTTGPTVDTKVAPSETEIAMLRSDGVGPVDFGTPADQAIAELTDVLGAPDRVDLIVPGGECVEGTGWLECLRALRIVDSGQLAVWDRYGLEVAFVDTARDVWPRQQTAMQFGDWHATVAPDDSRLFTDEGVAPGITVGELRTAVPSVEFTYNEGLLDSFYVPLDAGGGYWGRLDWDPTTTDIDMSDIAAVQQALNDHGADLVVDGEWGPSTQAAWTDFLTSHGIEPFTPQLWLTPRIGDALGLPPDDTIIATLEPRPATTPVDARSASEVLRVDGLGPVDFGTPAEAALAALVDRLGPPDIDMTSTDPECALAVELTRAISWNSSGLTLLFTDWAGSFELPPVPLHFASWTLAPPSPPRVSLTTVDGIGIGSDARQVRSLPNASPMIPDVTQWGFKITERSGAVSGAFDWSVTLPHYFMDEAFVVELQEALNRHGAKLVVDGIVGPQTTRALTDFASQHGIEGFNIRPASDSIELSAEVLEVFWLLELPPDHAPVATMWAGDPSTCG